LAIFTGIILFLHFKTTKDFDVLIYFLSAALIASLVLSAGEGVLKKFLNLRVLIWLGAISYSVYMSHASVEWVVNQFIRVVLKIPEVVGADGKSRPQLTDAQTLAACAAAAICVLLVSALVHNWVEKPMRERSRRFAFRNLR
jgi:peptidoglycan/LPS O-acetylase OafA/YrhL